MAERFPLGDLNRDGELELLGELMLLQSPTDTYLRLQRYVETIAPHEREAALTRFLSQVIYMTRQWAVRALELGATGADLNAVLERDQREIFERITAEE